MTSRCVCLPAVWREIVSADTLRRSRNVRRLNVWGPRASASASGRVRRQPATRCAAELPATSDTYFSSPLAPLHGQEIEILCCIGWLMAIYQNGCRGGGHRRTAWEQRPALQDQRWTAGPGVQKVKRGEPVLGERGYTTPWGSPSQTSLATQTFRYCTLDTSPVTMQQKV